MFLFILSFFIAWKLSGCRACHVLLCYKDDGMTYQIAKQCYAIITSQQQLDRLLYYVLDLSRYDRDFLVRASGAIHTLVWQGYGANTPCAPAARKDFHSVIASTPLYCFKANCPIKLHLFQH